MTACYTYWPNISVSAGSQLGWYDGMLYQLAYNISVSVGSQLGWYDGMLYLLAYVYFVSANTSRRNNVSGLLSSALTRRNMFTSMEYQRTEDPREDTKTCRGSYLGPDLSMYGYM